MQMTVTTLLCITTKDNKPANYFRQMVNRLNVKRTGLHFRKFEFSFVCGMCRAAGRTKQCRHMMNRLPKWQSQQKHDEIRNLMSDSDLGVLR